MKKTIVITTLTGQVIKGFFKTDSKESSLIIDTDVFGKQLHKFTTVDVKNVGPFIASYLANSKESEKFDEKFDTVEILGLGVGVGASRTRTKVLYKESKPKTQKFLVHPAIPGEFLELDSILSIRELSDSTMELRMNPALLGFKEIEVPIDFQYTKNPQINSILKSLNAPFDIHPNMSRMLSDNIHSLTIAFRQTNADVLYLGTDYRVYQKLNDFQLKKTLSNYLTDNSRTANYVAIKRSAIV